MKKRLLLSRLATITAFVFLAGQAWGALNWDGYFTNVLAKGNLRIGTGSTPDITQNGDDLFIEGQLEVDGVPRFDATTMILRGVTYTLPSADGTVGQQLTTNGSGTLSWAGPGTATAWDDISNPDANDTITFGTYTMALTGSQTAADGFTIENTGNFGNISVLKVQQITGNPTDGTVLEVISADTDADAMVVTANSVDVLKVNGAGTLTVTGATGITGDVAITGSLSTTGALGGFLKTVTNDVDAHSVTVGESGTVLTNAGNDGDPVGEFTLPSAAIGLTYTFVVMAAQELRVIPAAGDAINIAGVQGDAAEYWTANAVGETLTIVAVDVNNWVATSYSGTWTQQTP